MTATGQRVTTHFDLNAARSRLTSRGVKYGIMSRGRYPGHNKPTFVEVAFWVNFGTKYITAREFLKYPILAKKTEYKNFIAQLLRALTMGQKTENQIIGLLGQKVVSDVKTRITQIHAIQTGEMRKRITYEAVR